MEQIKEFKQVFIEAFVLVNKNLLIYIVSLSLAILMSLLSERRILSLLFFLVEIGWIGTKVALLLDSKLKNQANWNNLRIYWWKYFKKLLPVVPIFFLGSLLFVFVGVPLLVWYYTHVLGIPISSKDEMAIFVKEIPTLINNLNLRSLRAWLLALPTLLIYPFIYSFIPIIVFKDLPFFKGISKTIKLLITHKQLYLFLLILALLNSILSAIIISLLNVPVLPSTTFFANRIVLILVNQYVNLFTTSFAIVYLTSERT